MPRPRRLRPGAAWGRRGPLRAPAVLSAEPPPPCHVDLTSVPTGNWELRRGNRPTGAWGGFLAPDSLMSHDDTSITLRRMRVTNPNRTGY